MATAHLDRIATEQGTTPATMLKGTTEVTEADEVKAARDLTRARYLLKGHHERPRMIKAGPPVPTTPAEANGTPARAGSWAEFVKRFNPIYYPRGNGGAEGFLLDTFELAQCDPAHVWTVVEGDNGEWYACEGWHLVNRMGFIICRNPREALPLHGGAYKIFKY